MSSRLFVFRLSASRRTALFLMLAAALLCAQWMGLKHRIVHADGKSGQHRHSLHGVAPAQAEGMDDADHSCAAFDAATLADSVTSFPCLAFLVPGKHVLALWMAFSSWHAPLLLHFSSRAPPPI